MKVVFCGASCVGLQRSFWTLGTVASLVAGVGVLGRDGGGAAGDAATGGSTVYDYTVLDAEGRKVDLGRYRGKAMLIVNTASKCGFTSQYRGLEELHDKYGDKGLVVLAFPCNQFGGQEPGSNEEIQRFCSSKYDVTFPVFAKIKVNGSEADPLFRHLKNRAPGLAGTKRIKWNFTKFLVGKDGRVEKRYASRTKPQAIAKDIEKLLDL